MSAEPKEELAFVQIAVGMDTLYGLTKNGKVYRYKEKGGGWELLPMGTAAKSEVPMAELGDRPRKMRGE